MCHYNPECPKADKDDVDGSCKKCWDKKTGKCVPKKRYSIKLIEETWTENVWGTQHDGYTIDRPETVSIDEDQWLLIMSILGRC